MKYCSDRYIQQPLLLEGKKFDVRSYLLIACTAPYVLFFAQGYVRLTCVNYDAASDDLTVHLTNQVNEAHLVQKKGRLWLTEVGSKKDFRKAKNKCLVQAKSMPPGKGGGLMVRHGNRSEQKQYRIRFPSLPRTSSLLNLTIFFSLDLFFLLLFSHVSTDCKLLRARSL